MKSLGHLSVLSLLLTLSASLFCEPPAPQGNPKFWSNYNQGLMALHDGRPQEALAPLSAAIQITPDPRAYLAREVANTLTLNFDAALEDLRHAQQPVQPGQGRPSREPALWGYCVWAMSDKPFKGPNAPDTNWFSGIPGNIVQGGDDYPTDYASWLAYDMATAYRTARDAKKDVHSPALQDAFKKAGSWFANRNLATTQMAAFNLDNARQLLAKGQVASALEAANLALIAYPFDGDIRLVTGDAYRQLGRPETARREYTIALTMNTNSAHAYVGRALAATAQGDRHRAEEDLRAAQKYDPNYTAEFVQSVAALLPKYALDSSITPASALAKLDAAALAGGSVDQLVPLALDLQKSAAAGRLRYDEIYQDQLRTLEDATRDNPTNPDTFVAVASYLLDELNNRGESVEPRRATQYYRYQFSREMEVSRAIFALNQALKLNPKHTAALVRLAFAYDAINQTDKAEALINQVLQLTGTQNADAIRLLAQYFSEQIGGLQARAQYLRTPRYYSSSHTENRSDGVYQVTYTTRVDPSQAELQEADASDAQARVLMARAKSLMESAIANNPDNLDGLLLQAAYQNWFGTPEKALALLQQTVKKFPASLKAHDALLTFYLQRSMADEALEERLAATKLYQTTSGPLLEHIWQQITTNGWPPLVSELKRAREIDPVDARATAYLAAAQADAKQSAESLASKRTAVAMEVARLQLDDQAAGAKLPRAASDFALLMQMLGRTSVQEAMANQVDTALADIRTAAAFHARFAPGGDGELMFQAMIPDPEAPAVPVPTPVNGSTLAAQTYVTAGRFLMLQSQKLQGKAAKDKVAEALAYFQSAANLARPYKSSTPQVGNARGETNYSQFASGPVVVYAWFALAQAYVAEGNYQAAFDALNNAGANHPDRNTALQINDLMLQVVQHLNAKPRP